MWSCCVYLCTVLGLLPVQNESNLAMLCYSPANKAYKREYLSLKNPTWSRMQTTATPFSYCELESFRGNIRRCLQIPFILYHVKDCEVLGSTARRSLSRGPVLVAWYHLVLDLHKTDFIRDVFLPTSTHYRDSLLRPPRAPLGRGYQYGVLPIYWLLCSRHALCRRNEWLHLSR